MKTITSILAITLSLLSFSSIAQKQQHADTNQYVLDGRIVNREDMSSMYLVHIMNLDQGTGTISKIDGRFKIWAEIGDTILLSSVGYEKKKIIVSKSILEYENGVLISMLPQAIQMDEVVIQGKTFAQFRDEFVALKVEPLVIDELILEGIQEQIQLIGPATARGFQGPISFLYERYNKSARLARALEKNREKYGNPYDYKDYPIKINYFSDVEHRLTKP